MNDRKGTRIMIAALVMFLLLYVSIMGMTFLSGIPSKQNNEIAPVETMPNNWKNVSIEVDNTDRSGNPLPVPVYDGSDPLDDNDIDNKQMYSDVLSPVLNVKIVGECRMWGNTIVPPRNYLHGCWWQAPEGGIIYSGHSVKGPRVGTFELIAKKDEGDVLNIGGTEYRINRKMIVSNEKLPDLIMRDGMFSIITCLADSRADKTGVFTQNVIMILENV